MRCCEGGCRRSVSGHGQVCQGASIFRGKPGKARGERVGDWYPSHEPVVQEPEQGIGLLEVREVPRRLALWHRSRASAHRQEALGLHPPRQHVRQLAVGAELVAGPARRRPLQVLQCELRGVQVSTGTVEAKAAQPAGSEGNNR
jgi:hypothetical protein